MPRHPVSMLLLAVATSPVSGALAADGSFLDPKGPVAAQESHLFYAIIGLMLFVLVPIAIAVPFVAWHYRRSNRRADFRPDWDFSAILEVLVWGGPIVLLFAIGALLWPNTLSLDPYRPLDTTTKPLNVQVVGLDWKWLFIYPDQHIATVKQLAFPAGRPLHLTLTSDTVMQSFFIPALGSQIYAMAGMKTQLNLKADRTGTFLGENTQFNGMGFQKQKFQAIAMTPRDFDDWLAEVRRSGKALDRKSYEKLLQKSSPAAPIYYASVGPDFFRHIVDKYNYASTDSNKGARAE